MSIVCYCPATSVSGTLVCPIYNTGDHLDQSCGSLHQCRSDSDCNGYKCCLLHCGYRCAPPIEVDPTTGKPLEHSSPHGLFSSTHIIQTVFIVFNRCKYRINWSPILVDLSTMQSVEALIGHCNEMLTYFMSPWCDNLWGDVEMLLYFITRMHLGEKIT